MVDMASWFYGIVYDAFLKHLIRRVRKSKKPMDNWNARVLNRYQEEERKCIHGEMLRQGALIGQRQEKASGGLNKIGKNEEKSE
jgi:hypothetical protein